MIIILDSGPVGLTLTSGGTDQARRCREWLRRHLRSGTSVCLPEVVDYEHRRIFLHRGMSSYLRRLEDLHRITAYLPITTAAMRRAAELWAEARRIGRKTADDKALDIDMILCAQVQVLGERAPEQAVVATTNVAHLAPFVNAKHWSDFEPQE